MFHETGRYGLLWYRHGELPWLKWFAFNWRLRSVVFSIIVATAFTVLLFGVAWLFGYEALSTGRIGTGLVMTVAALFCVVTVVVPTIASKSIVAKVSKNSDYRFGAMLGERSWRHRVVAPSIVVLRAFESATVPFEKQSAGLQELINRWLSDTWSDDYAVWEARSRGRTPRDAEALWRAVTSRIESFIALPAVNVPPVGRILDELAAGLYMDAYHEIQRHLAMTEAALVGTMAFRDQVKIELEEFAEQAPEGAVLPKLVMVVEDVSTN